VVDGSGVIGGVCRVGDGGDGDSGSGSVDGGGVVGRVGESDIWDRIDRLVGSIFGFGRKTRRKTFPAAAVAGDGGGRRMVAGGGGGRRLRGGRWGVCVNTCMKMK
nr:hypothetical protein [Tanacetum cinerariifolium]